MKSGKIRLDLLLLGRGLAETRQKAQAMILSGSVLVDEEKIEKCGASVREDGSVRLLGARAKYVSRGGLKLEGALDHFSIEVDGKICLDVGASTGGFTDCLLQRGAAKVTAVDAGRNQLDWRLRSDPRVRSLERTNARTLCLEQIGEKAGLATVDVSFISATLIIAQLPPLLGPGADLLVLVKPQFEVGRGRVGKGGIVRDPELHRKAVTRVLSRLEELRFGEIRSTESGIQGAEGNREFFLHARWLKEGQSDIFF